MATYNKFNSAVQDLLHGITLASDTLAGLLIVPGAPTPPVAGDNVIDTSTTPCTLKATSNILEIAAGNGYTKGGINLTVTTNSQSAGTYTLAANQLVWTCVTAAMASFRYIVLYDVTAGAAASRPVIAWWDYGATVTLNVGETFTVKFNNANPGTIFTVV
jgi:hypothetical protein